MVVAAGRCQASTLSEKMSMIDGLWGGLPLEIVDRVLSFIPVPVLCKFRAVCKRWNSLISTSAFQDLCAQNEEQNSYVLLARNMLVTRSVKSRGWRLLDLTERKWYTIRDEFLGHLEGMETFSDRRTVAVDSGLICLLYTKSAIPLLQASALVVCNPIAKTVKKLPPLKLYPCFDNYYEPVVMMEVDHKSRSYKIVVVNNRPKEHPLPRMHLYESSTDQWRNLRNPPYELNPEAPSSSVMFQGLLYTVFTTVHDDNRFFLLTYNFQGDLWSKVRVCVPKDLRVPQLVVSDDRLFIIGGWEKPIQRPILEIPSPDRRLEIWEIMTDEKVCLRELQMPHAMLEMLWSNNHFYWSSYWSDLDDSVGCNSHIFAVGLHKSILLVSSSGKLMKYDLAQRSLDRWPSAWRYTLIKNKEVGEGCYARGTSLNLSPLL